MKITEFNTIKICLLDAVSSQDRPSRYIMISSTFKYAPARIKNKQNRFEKITVLELAEMAREVAQKALAEHLPINPQELRTIAESIRILSNGRLISYHRFWKHAGRNLLKILSIILPFFNLSKFIGEEKFKADQAKIEQECQAIAALADILETNPLYPSLNEPAKDVSATPSPEDIPMIEEVTAAFREQIKDRLELEQALQTAIDASHLEWRKSGLEVVPQFERDNRTRETVSYIDGVWLPWTAKIKPTIMQGIFPDNIEENFKERIEALSRSVDGDKNWLIALELLINQGFSNDVIGKSTMMRYHHDLVVQYPMDKHGQATPSAIHLKINRDDKTGEIISIGVAMKGMLQLKRGTDVVAANFCKYSFGGVVTLEGDKVKVSVLDYKFDFF